MSEPGDPIILVIPRQEVETRDLQPLLRSHAILTPVFLHNGLFSGQSGRK